MHSNRMRMARSFTMGGVPAQVLLPCGQNSWHMLLKILPCPNFVAGGKYFHQLSKIDPPIVKDCPILVLTRSPRLLPLQKIEKIFWSGLAPTYQCLPETNVWFTPLWTQSMMSRSSSLCLGKVSHSFQTCTCVNAPTDMSSHFEMRCKRQKYTRTFCWNLLCTVEKFKLKLRC